MGTEQMGTTGASATRSPWIERWLAERRQADGATAPAAGESVTEIHLDGANVEVVLTGATAELERAALEHRAAIDRISTAGVTRLRWAADEHYDALTSTCDRRTEELAKLAAEHRAILEDVHTTALAELRWVADEQRQGVAEAGKARTRDVELAKSLAVHDLEQAASAHLAQVDAVAASAWTRLEEVTTDAAVAFEELARRIQLEAERGLGEEAASLRAELVAEAARLHDTTAERIAEVLALTDAFASEAAERHAQLETRAAEMHDELAGTAIRREAEIERSVREHAAGIERLTASVHELVEASADRMAGLSAHVDEQRTRAEELAAEKMRVLDELILRVQALETSTAQHIVELDERSARVTELANAKLEELGDVARATSEALRIQVEGGIATVDTAITDKLEVALGEHLGALEQRAATESEALAVAAVAWSQQAQEEFDARVSGFESTLRASRAALANTAAELRTELESARDELDQQLREDVERQVGGLERAGTAWLGRIDQAGKRRRAHVRRRRAAPPAAVLAAGAVATGAFGTSGRSLEPRNASGVPPAVHAVDTTTVAPTVEAPDDATNVVSLVSAAGRSATPASVVDAGANHVDAPPPTSEQPTLLDGVVPAAACDALEQLDLDC